MNRSRTAAAAAAAFVVAGGAATASGAFAGSPSVPPAKPLATAVHDAVTAPAVKGITARISFTNKLIDSSSLASGGPLLSGAKGRLWLADDGRARLELQSERGDAQVTSDGKTVTLYDASSNTAYVATLPAEKAAKDTPEAPPSIDRIKKAIARLSEGADLTGPAGTSVAGHEAYSVRFAPKHDGGLIGAGELAWDAATGVPLRAGIYAAGSSQPVLELAATDVTYGPVEASALSGAVPSGAKVNRVDLAGKGRDAHGKDVPAVTGADAVAKAVPFALAAPKTLVGLPRKEVRLVDLDAGDKGALVTYGAHLGGIAVLQQPAKAAAPKPAKGGEDRSQLQLPKVSIDGAAGDELATALGTVVRFRRGGVQYTVIGSVPPAAAEAAARGL